MGMKSAGARVLRLISSFYSITMALYNHALLSGADNSEFVGDKGLRGGGEDSMKQIIEYMRSFSKALLRKMGVYVAEHSRHETVRRGGRSLRAERRRETRSPRISPCTYGLTRSVDRDGVILEEGHGTAVNDSSTGMRLLLGIAPSKGQLLEIQTGHSTRPGEICLVEVCWTKPLREDAQEALYLVGCRQDFGSTHGEAI